jgi:hypothetical protein
MSGQTVPADALPALLANEGQETRAIQPDQPTMGTGTFFRNRCWVYGWIVEILNGWERWAIGAGVGTATPAYKVAKPDGAVYDNHNANFAAGTVYSTAGYPTTEGY